MSQAKKGGRFTMSTLSLVRKRRLPSRGITTLADVPVDRSFKVLHLCRFPEKCCSVCQRHKSSCWHDRVGFRAF